MTSISMPSTIAVVGAGRLGTALARALRGTNHVVVGPLGRDEVASADLVLVCVPDEQISAVAARFIGRTQLIGHLSGATPLAALADADVPALGLHPLQTFRKDDPPDRFRGVGCATAGTTAAAAQVAEALARALGMNPFPISETGRAAYHAAACLASNYLLTVLEAAERLAAVAGLDREATRTLFAPLVGTTIQNWRGSGPAASLTGPVARGDQATLAAHRRVITQHVPELTTLVDQLVADTAALVVPSPDHPGAHP